MKSNNNQLKRVEPMPEARNLPQLLSGSCHNSVNGRVGQKTRPATSIQCPATPPFRDVINEWQAAGLGLALAPTANSQRMQQAGAGGRGQWPAGVGNFDGDKYIKWNGVKRKLECRSRHFARFIFYFYKYIPYIYVYVYI